jgi:hypothetical protein
MADPVPAASNPWAEAPVEPDLASVRASLDAARANGWRETDQIGLEIEQYLGAVRDARQRTILARLLATEDRPTVTA